MVIHDTGTYRVEKLADKHYVIYYEDEYEVKLVKSFNNELSALRACDKLANNG